MLTLFTNTYRVRGQIYTYPSLFRYRQNIQNVVSDIQHYVRTIANATSNDHPFVQSLKHCAGYQNNVFDVYNQTYARYPYIAKALNFATEYNRGSFKGHKVYPFSDNMVLCFSEYVSPQDTLEKWSTASPVKCFWTDTPYVDMRIPSPMYPPRDGLACSLLDLPTLAVMYKGFKLSRSLDKNQEDEVFVLGEEHFMRMHVLPNMLPSQVDASIISAFIAVHEGRYESQQRVDAPQFFASYSKDFLDIAKTTLERVSDTRMQYVHILQHIPSVYNIDGYETLKLVDYSPTLQLEWAMFASRAKVIQFLLNVGGKTGQRANQGTINEMKTYVRRLRQSTVPFDSMSTTVADLVENTMSRIERL